MRAATRDELAVLKDHDRALHTTHVELIVDAMTRLEVAIENLRPAAMRLEHSGGFALDCARTALSQAESALAAARGTRTLLK